MVTCDYCGKSRKFISKIGQANVCILCEKNQQPKTSKHYKEVKVHNYAMGKPIKDI